MRRTGRESECENEVTITMTVTVTVRARPGNSKWGKSLSTIHLLIKVASFMKR
jgi:hypothetical protein